MLAGGSCPCLPSWPIRSIALQARRLAFEIDDIVVEVIEPHSFSTAKLRCQIKRELGFSQGNTTFASVVAAAWRDFDGLGPNDAIAIISGPLSRTDDDLRQMLEWARTSTGATDYLEKIELGKFSSDNKRRLQRSVEHHLTNANSGTRPDPDKLWRFLKSLYLLQFDLDIAKSISLTFAELVIAQFGNARSGIWAQIVDAVQGFNQAAGTITKDTLPPELVTAFERRPTATFADSGLDRQATAPVAPSAEMLPVLALAQLAGSWRDDNAEDRRAVEQIVNEPYESFIRKLRADLRRPGTPFAFRNGRWFVADRAGAWTALGDLVFGDDIDRFASTMLDVFKSVDSQPGDDSEEEE